jgi:DnaJ domain
MDFERLAEAFMDAILPGFKQARKHVRAARPPRGTQRPPAAPPPPFDPDAAVLQFIWDNARGMGIIEQFGGSFPRFQQAYAQGWIRWSFDGHFLHIWVGPPSADFHDRTSPPKPMVDDAIPAAIRALGLKPVPLPSPDAMRAAFRKLAPTCHPDRFPGDARKLARYKKLTAAYAVLKGEKLA